jgi:hypothetical protein
MSLKILQYEEDGIIVLNSRLDIYVRLDIVHLIKIIGRWKCFKIRSHGKIKEFYFLPGLCDFFLGITKYFLL